MIRYNRTIYNIFSLLLLTIFIECFGCGNKPKPVTNQTASDDANKVTLSINDKRFDVELAINEEQRSQGLMYREALAENSGMLFVFDQQAIYPFWMKNTKIPLSIAFIDKNFAIIDIQEMIPNQEEVRYAPENSFLYALEMNQGWFFKSGVKIGDKVDGIIKSTIKR